MTAIVIKVSDNMLLGSLRNLYEQGEISLENYTASLYRVRKTITSSSASITFISKYPLSCLILTGMIMSRKMMIVLMDMMRMTNELAGNGSGD